MALRVPDSAGGIVLLRSIVVGKSSSALLGFLRWGRGREHVRAAGCW